MRNILRFSFLRQVQYISGAIQVLALLLVEMFYIHVDRKISNKNLVDTTTLKLWRESAIEMVYVIGPAEAELTMTTMVGSVAISCSSICLIYLWFYGRDLLSQEKLSCLFYLYDGKQARIAISNRLDHYIDLLIMSNRNHTRRLKFMSVNIKAQIHDLHDELSFLQYLKQDKLDVWPQNRDNPEWLQRIRRLFLKVYLSSFLGIFITSEAAIVGFSRITRIYRSSKGIKRHNGFWAYKCLIDNVLLGYQDSDLAAILLSLIVIIMVDNIEIMYLNRIPVKNLLHCCEKLRSVESSREFSSNMKYETSLEEVSGKWRFKYSKCAIIAYIKFRYTLDASVFRQSKDLVRVLLGGSASIFIITVTIHRSRFEYEAELFLIVASSMFLVVNGILIACAFRHARYSKQLNRLIVGLASSTFEPFDHSEKIMSYDRIIPSHISLLIRRLVANQFYFEDRLAIKLFGVVVNYGGVIRLNAVLIYIIMIVLMYKR